MLHSHFFPVAALSSLISSAGATPFGLNNIPTADTVPQGPVVGQAFSTLGSGTDDFWLSSKTGLGLGPAHFEFGLTSRLIPDEAGPLTGHAKLALPFGEGLPALAVGAANITFSGSDESWIKPKSPEPRRKSASRPDPRLAYLPLSANKSVSYLSFP